MIISFSGDPFLVARAARAALRADQDASGRGVSPTPSATAVDAESVTVMGEGLQPEDIREALAQGGLFGRVTLLLDFDEAFTGRSDVKPRNEAIKVLADAPEDAIVVVMDSKASASRQKAYQELGRHQHLPAPRYQRLAGWIGEELRGSGIRFRRDVPETLADLFGEDLPAIASEITKLAVLDEEELTAERVRELANRPAARDAFQLIEAIARGDAPNALAIARDLLLLGEPPQRVFGALTWQFLLVAKAVGLLASDARAASGNAAAALGAKPFVAKRALTIAADLDEVALRRVLSTLLAADQRSKTGQDPAWALESAVITLAGEFGPRRMAAAGGRSRTR